MATEELQIVARIVGGKTSEFRYLVERYQQPVFRFAYNMLGNRHDAEDIAQEVFVAAFNNLRSYDLRQSSLSTWLLTITRNRCINRWKQRRPTTDCAAPLVVDAQGPEANVIRNEFWQELDAALGTLPVDQKTAFVLAEIEQLTYEEIAAIEDTSLGTVKSRIHRAKQKLRQLLGTDARKS